MRETSVVEVDLSAVAHNLRVLRRIVGPETAICPVVKADGYGLGASRVAKCLVQAGAEMLAVYTGGQAAELFKAAISGPVLVLMPLTEIGRADELYRGLVCGRLHLSVHDVEHLEHLIRLSERYAVTIPVHLEVDTGMSRGGCDLCAAPAALARIAQAPRLRLAGLYTHFSCAETDEVITDRQDQLFTDLIAANEQLVPRDCLVHAANTCATLRKGSYHRSMVRVGQAWAGYGVEMLRGGQRVAEAELLRPAVTWSSRIIQVKRIPEGASVGYGATWTCRRPTTIGLVPVGYADGYPYALGAGPRRADGRAREPEVSVLVEGPAGIERMPAPVVGNVNMDQITIDLTDVVDPITCDRSDASAPAPETEAHWPAPRVRVGTTVELITADRRAPNHLSCIAEAAGTTPYEILCRLNPRIPRRYRVDAPIGIEIMPQAGAARRAAAVAG